MGSGVILGVDPRHHAALSQSPCFRFGWVYIWFFRGTPVLVQLFFWYVGSVTCTPA